MNLKSLALLLALATPLAASEAMEVTVNGVTITSKALAGELDAYIKADMKAKDGWFIIYDDVEKAFLKLKPTKLDSGAHIHYLGEGKFLSWGEFKAEGKEGASYMIDFYFDVVEEALQMSAPLTIYSKDKVKRYDWDEKGPVMKKLEIGAAKKDKK